MQNANGKHAPASISARQGLRHSAICMACALKKNGVFMACRLSYYDADVAGPCNAYRLFIPAKKNSGGIPADKKNRSSPPYATE